MTGPFLPRPIGICLFYQVHGVHPGQQETAGIPGDSHQQGAGAEEPREQAGGETEVRRPLPPPASLPGDPGTGGLFDKITWINFRISIIKKSLSSF